MPPAARLRTHLILISCNLREGILLFVVIDLSVSQKMSIEHPDSSTCGRAYKSTIQHQQHFLLPCCRYCSRPLLQLFRAAAHSSGASREQPSPHVLSVDAQLQPDSRLRVSIDISLNMMAEKGATEVAILARPAALFLQAAEQATPTELRGLQRRILAPIAQCRALQSTPALLQ